MKDNKLANSTGTLSILFFLALTFSSLNAFAASGGHKAQTSLLPYWIHFLVYLFLLTFALKKPVRSLIANRRSSIAEKVQKSSSELKRAKQEFEIAEEKINGVNQEAEALIDRLEKSGKEEKIAILNEAERQCVRIATRTEESLTAEKRTMLKQVQEELIDGVVDTAIQKIRNTVTKENDLKRREQSITSSKSLFQSL